MRCNTCMAVYITTSSLVACGPAEIEIACYQAGNVRMACDPYSGGWPWELPSSVEAIERESGQEIPPTYVWHLPRQDGDPYGECEINAIGDNDITIYAESQHTVDTRSLLHELMHSVHGLTTTDHPRGVFGPGGQLDRATCDLIHDWPGCQS